MIDFARVFGAAPNAYVLLDRSLVIVAANQAYARVCRTPLDQLIGRPLFTAFPNPGDHASANSRIVRTSFERVFATGREDVIPWVRFAIPCRDRPDANEERSWSATNTPIFDDAGQVAWVLQHTEDVTDLHPTEGPAPTRRPLIETEVFRRAESVARENRLLLGEMEEMRELFAQAPGIFCAMRGPEHVFTMANRAYLDFIGNREIHGRPVREVFHELGDSCFFEQLDRVYATGEPYVGKGVRIALAPGPGGAQAERICDFVYQPVFGSDGSVQGVVGLAQDNTEQWRAEQELQLYRDHLEQMVEERTRALKESEAERRQAEAALRHAQKMEAIGNLTGGVAHDFNNLLQVLMGCLQLLQTERLERGNRARLETAMRTVDKGARLASQLLAFARRQPVEPVALDLTEHVGEMKELVQRAVGEGVEVVLDLPRGLGSVLVDPTQLENSVLNLAINARDAMKGRGRLHIRATASEWDAQRARVAQVEPGRYLELRFADTGCGMPPEVLDRAMDPFFTTKADGQGTGLGLSTVYGSVKQVGGHLEIESQPGEGTTVTLAFPTVAQAAAATSSEQQVATPGGTERILVVEDDPDVRETVVEVLGSLGYQVSAAEDPESALARLQEEPFDLLFSDVVMPGPIGCRELARQAQALHPELQVLFTSGYAEDEVAHGGRLDPGIHLLAKPYRSDELDRRLRSLLDRPAAVASTASPRQAQ